MVVCGVNLERRRRKGRKKRGIVERESRSEKIGG